MVLPNPITLITLQVIMATVPATINGSPKDSLYYNHFFEATFALFFMLSHCQWKKLKLPIVLIKFLILGQWHEEEEIYFVAKRSSIQLFGPSVLA
jgi:hypothetical protein